MKYSHFMTDHHSPQNRGFYNIYYNLCIGLAQLHSTTTLKGTNIFKKILFYQSVLKGFKNYFKRIIYK